jgi:hypothetical protein
MMQATSIFSLIVYGSKVLKFGMLVRWARFFHRGPLHPGAKTITFLSSSPMKPTKESNLYTKILFFAHKDTF